MAGMTSAQSNPLGVEWFGLVMGLGFTLSWAMLTNFFLVFSAPCGGLDDRPRRRPPLIAAVPKMFFPALVILPGMIALALPTPQQRSRHGRGPHADGEQRRERADSPQIDVATGNAGS